MHSDEHSSCVFMAKAGFAVLSISIPQTQVSIQMASEAGASKHDHGMETGELENRVQRVAAN